MTKIHCARCNGSGEIGKRGKWSEVEAPGPVPDDARHWHAAACPDCHGEGDIDIYAEEGEDDHVCEEAQSG
jgi:hypothetical protein